MKKKSIETPAEEVKIETIEETPVVEATAEENPSDVLVLSEYDHKKLDKDIKYRGPLSYRYLRLIGWLAMIIMFVSMVLGATMKIKSGTGAISPEQMETFERVSSILSYAAELPLPLFLIANFAIILQQKNNYKKLILTYLKIFLMIYVGFLFVYYHYIVILLMRLGEVSFLEARQASIEIFTLLGKQSGLVVNVFVDLLCCVLIMFFINYTPKTRFLGKKIILFRALVALPILYEVTSAALMGLLGMNALSYEFTFSLPPEILALLGKKPIGMIVAFVVICIYIKIREKLYLKKGGTEAGYELYVKTNRDSLKLSLVMAITFFAVAIIDAALLIGLSVATYGNSSDLNYLEIVINFYTNFTLGKSVCLILVIPFVLLFSYSKVHADNKIDKLLPIAGIGLIIFAIIETLFFSVLF